MVSAAGSHCSALSRHYISWRCRPKAPRTPAFVSVFPMLVVKVLCFLYQWLGFYPAPWLLLWCCRKSVPSMCRDIGDVEINSILPKCSFGALHNTKCVNVFVTPTVLLNQIRFCNVRRYCIMHYCLLACSCPKFERLNGPTLNTYPKCATYLVPSVLWNLKCQLYGQVIYWLEPLMQTCKIWF